jgi:hypothetical protein
MPAMRLFQMRARPSQPSLVVNVALCVLMLALVGVELLRAALPT